jgi:uncharacterized repeat protein (TIGR03803 family)
MRHRLQSAAASKPCRSVQRSWTYTVLYQVTAASDGNIPTWGALVYDRSGNLYGATTAGGGLGCGSLGCGTVYELSPSNGGWTESMLHRFSGSDGANPNYSGVILDSHGNLYGTTSAGGPLNYGTVFELTNPGSGWQESLLYAFLHNNDDQGRYPNGGLILDGQGNLYGTTPRGGVNHGGTAFELSFAGGMGFSVVYSLSGSDQSTGSIGSLTLGPDGSLYGATAGNGLYLKGAVFKLTPWSGGWTYTSLHDFTGGYDGSGPTGNLVFDAAGNLYGTAESGGSGFDGGVVFEITP